MINKSNIMGKLIVFEGLDGCFKETNSKRLADYIRDNYNDKTILISYPQYESQSSFFVTNYLSGKYGQLNNINAYTATTFYALDRYHNKNMIDNLLKDGYTVILDRYVGSNLLYQSTKFDDKNDMNKFIDWCIDLEYNKNGLHKEDITLFMYIPVKANYQNLKNRDDKNGIKNDIYESNMEYQLKLDKNHKYICNKLCWNIVKCYKLYRFPHAKMCKIYDKDTIFSNILDILNRYFD